MSKENKVLLVANYLHDHPKATGKQVARKFKCALSYAYVLMSKAKSIEMSVEEVVDEIAAFPSGEHDDLVDATTLALMRFRQGGFLRLPSDEPEEPKFYKRRNAVFY
jgi:phage terminase large subunit-like protein